MSRFCVLQLEKIFILNLDQMSLSPYSGLETHAYIVIDEK